MREFEENPEINMDRRKYVKALASAGAGFSISSGTYLQPGTYDLGLQPEEIDSDLQWVLYENYSERQVDRLLEQEKALVLDFRYFEGERMSKTHVDAIEGVLKQAGVNAVALEYEEELNVDLFREYGFTGEDLLMEGGLWDLETEEVMKDAAVQLYFVPGKLEKPHRREMKAMHGGENIWAEGLTVQSERPRSALSFSAPYRMEGTVHEIGHALGLDHVVEEENVMHAMLSDDMELEFTEQQSERIQDNL